MGKSKVNSKMNLREQTALRCPVSSKWFGVERNIIQMGNGWAIRERKGKHLYYNLTFYLGFPMSVQMKYAIHNRGKHWDKYFDLDEISFILIAFYRCKELQQLLSPVKNKFVIHCNLLQGEGEHFSHYLFQ